jgi:hypothetical protein
MDGVGMVCCWLAGWSVGLVGVTSQSLAPGFKGRRTIPTAGLTRSPAAAPRRRGTPGRGRRTSPAAPVVIIVGVALQAGRFAGIVCVKTQAAHSSKHTTSSTRNSTRTCSNRAATSPSSSALLAQGVGLPDDPLLKWTKSAAASRPPQQRSARGRAW